MEGKKIVVLSVLVAALLLSLAPGLIAEVETRRVLSFTEWGLRVRVYAPYQAYPGDTIEVRVTARALEDLADIYITIDIFGSKSEEGKEGYDSWDDYIRFLRGVDWVEGDDKDRDYDVEIPEDSDPGLVYGHVTAEWTTVLDGKDHTYAESFTITYIMNEDYENIKDLLEDHGYVGNETGLEDLLEDYDATLSERDAAISERDRWKTDYASVKSDYDSLKATYNSLRSSYDSLEADYKTLSSDYDALQKKYKSLDSEHKSLLADYEDLESDHETTLGELSNYRTYTYALAVATVIFIVTTIIFAVRRPGVA
jgi:hypothetical protein